MLFDADFWKPNCQSLGSLAKSAVGQVKKSVYAIFLIMSFYTVFR
jgi:hypothetical protein